MWLTTITDVNKVDEWSAYLSVIQSFYCSISEFGSGCDNIYNNKRIKHMFGRVYISH